jgi:hypothetical protein
VANSWLLTLLYTTISLLYLQNLFAIFMDPRILEAPNIEHVDLRVFAVEGDFHQHLNVPLDAKGKYSASSSVDSAE